MIRYRKLFPASAILLTGLSLVTACSDSATEPQPSATTPTQELQVDASTAFAYVQLGDTAKVLTVADAGASTTWDLGLFSTTVTVNGGSAGPGGVSAACLCPSSTPSDAQIQAFTPATQLTRFDTVKTTSIPGALQFVGDSLSPALKSWYNGTASAAATAKPATTYIIVEGTTAPVYTKIHITAIAGASATSPGQVTFEYATQATAGATPFGTLQTKTVNVGATPVYFDLKTGAETTAAGAWSIQFRGWQIRANSGASGTGSVSVVDASPSTMDQVTLAFAQSIPSVAFSRDVFSGVFGTSPWYKYNITGTDNQIWPVFNVYVIKRGTNVYKVQLINYYNTQGQSRRITIRYARIAR